MNNTDYFSLVPGFETSSESDLMHEYTTTMNSTEIETVYHYKLRMGIGIVVLVLSGFFLIVVIVAFCQACFKNRWGAEVRGMSRLVEPRTPPTPPQGAEVREMSRLVEPRTPPTPSRGSEVREMSRLVEPRTPPTPSRGSEVREMSRLVEPRTPPTPSRGSEVREMSRLVEPRTPPTPSRGSEVRGMSRLVEPRTYRTPSDGIFSWNYMSIQYLKRRYGNEEQGEAGTSIFLNPLQNEETIFLPESSIREQMPESSKNIEEKSSEEVNVASSEHADGNKTPLLKRGSQSSPTSPDTERKRHSSFKDAHQRSSSSM